MNRSYELRTDDIIDWATFTKDDVYFEVPHSDDESNVQERIDRVLLNNALTKVDNSQFIDDVYSGGSVVRQDHTIGTSQGAAILAELQEAFPDYADFARDTANIVGKYDGYREPYQNASISWYDFGVMPSEQLQLSFNTSYPNSNMINWYGMKFDLVTKDVLLKVVIKDYDGAKPELPVGDCFYAITHHEDGATSDWVDTYVYATPKRIREFCADKGLAYPLPENAHKECDVVWCWGFVFNKDTLEYGAVKGYARYNQ